MTLAKVHAWDLNYGQIVYLDADTLVLQNIDSLFSYLDQAEFAAAPGSFNNSYFIEKISVGLIVSTVESSAPNQTKRLTRIS